MTAFILVLLAVSFLVLPGCLAYQKLREWNAMRKWKGQYKSNLVPLRKR